MRILHLIFTVIVRFNQENKIKVQQTKDKIK